MCAAVAFPIDRSRGYFGLWMEGAARADDTTREAHTMRTQSPPNSDDAHPVGAAGDLDLDLTIAQRALAGALDGHAPITDALLKRANFVNAQALNAAALLSRATSASDADSTIKITDAWYALAVGGPAGPELKDELICGISERLGRGAAESAAVLPTVLEETEGSKKARLE